MLLRHLHVFSNMLWGFDYEHMRGLCRVADVLLPISSFGVSLKGCPIRSTGYSWCLITYGCSQTSSDHTADYFSNEKF